jgi:ABC-type lipoprotein release transport system permease subunit
LAGLVGLLGVASVGNTLVASVRQRRRDLAVLKTIGMVRRQVAAVVAWQATSFSVVPTIAIGIIVPATLVATNAIAAWPGWAAARVEPAVVLRGE